MKTALVSVLFPVTTAELPLTSTFTSSIVQAATFISPDLKAARSSCLLKPLSSALPLKLSA
jgi:hypothetical protein